MLLNYDPRKQGNIGLVIAIEWFTLANYTVCIPLTDIQEYDLIVEKSGILQRVQVKFTSIKNLAGNYKVDLRTVRGTTTGYKIKSFKQVHYDLLFIITERKEKYLIPTDKIKVKTTITLNREKDRFTVS